MNGKDGSIQVVLAVYDPSGTYSRHAGVVMTSLLARTRSPVCLSVLHDATLTSDNRERMERTASAFEKDIRFVDVSDAVARMGDNLDDITGTFSRGTLFRLLIPELLNAEKALYLDCDIAVNLDVAELWAIDIEDVSLAAVPDRSVKKAQHRLHEKVRCRVMRYDAENYFNAGVLLMNLPRIRQKYDLVREAARFFRRYRLCLDYPDQDLFNVLFRDDARLIDERFNRITNHHDIENAILHLTGKYKPWSHHLCEPRDRFYWQIFAQSEWRDQLVDAMLDMYENNPVAHQHTSDCIRRILGRWEKDILMHNGIVRAGRDFMICLNERRYRSLSAKPDTENETAHERID